MARSRIRQRLVRAFVATTLAMTAVTLAPSNASAATSVYAVRLTPLPGGMVRGEITRAGVLVARYVARAGTTAQVVDDLAPDGTVTGLNVGLRPIAVGGAGDVSRFAATFDLGLEQIEAFVSEIAQGECILACGEGGGDGGTSHPNPFFPVVTPGVGGFYVADQEEGAGYIWDSGCLEIGGDHPMKGCYIRRTVDDRDSSAWYSADSSKATIGATNYWTTHVHKQGYTELRYGGSETVVDWKPAETMYSGSCQTVTIGANWESVGVSETFLSCPNRIDPSVGTRSFRSTWTGCTNDANEVAALSEDKIPEGQPSSLEYWIGETWGPCRF